MKSSRNRRHAVAAACVLLASLHVRADDEALRPIAFQNGVNQQTLGAETADLARELTALIDELQRNGFPLQSLSGLTELATQLNSLGGTEMTAIAQRLRKLGENAQADPRATATEAYIAQQAIETRLKTLARQISIQQLREEAARRLEALIGRQIAIQRETRAIASVKPDAERQRLLESDQSGIGEDLATFFQTGENLLARLRENDASPAARPPAPPSPATPAAPGAPAAAPAGQPTFAERINGPYLTTLSSEAVDHLKGKRYPDAYGRQEALIVELRKILQNILSSLPKEQRLASALQQVSALRQQEEARAETKTATPETNQAAADQAQNLANQVAPLSPEAAAALQSAQNALQNPAAGQPAPPPPAASRQTAATPPSAKPQTPAATPPRQASAPQTAPPQPAPKTQNGQKSPPSAAQSLATAEAALRTALTQAQSESANSQNQAGQPPASAQGNPPPQPGKNGPQQAGNQQPGQPQNQPGQPQPGQGRPPQPGQPGRQNAQLGQDGVPPGQQQGEPQSSGNGGTQTQIAGHGPDSAGPAQVVGALRREEREAFNALQNERYPAEYSAWVQQYWRNLAQDQ